MMATESSVAKPADVPVAPELRPQADQAQHVPPESSDVNGGPSLGADDIENKRITIVEEQSNSADVSVSGGSDTETSRTDGARQKDSDKSHGRTSSLARKPATFKAVSVNKTFLAAKASPGGGSPKTSERPTPSSNTPPPGLPTLSTSRPRLVAKTGSGARDSTPRFSSVVNGAKPATAPDPSVVWNKNRPPEPKKFTDEELKKYGIHMASRLNEEDAQGQNKWADIDDDDDDWAPEAITWGDGTKTTLPHPDEAATVVSDSGSVGSKGKPMEKPKSPTPMGLSAPVLTKSSSLASGKGLVLKPASQEKPALVAKPPAPPAPAKSPWATLPPIERASPAAAEVIRTQTNTSFKGATKEIAADEFGRPSWREGGSHGNRELYNSHSGRYEPVFDRRGSMRSDTHSKHPALLQRPQPADQPAEPSSAFQTNRISQDAPFGRRRGSSNVSGGSGSFLQRLSKGSDGAVQPSSELLSARRPSLAGSGDSPLSPVASHAQPRQQPQQGWVPRSSPSTTFAAPHDGPPPAEPNMVPSVPAQPVVDEVEYQKKLMRERVELARKRRQEQEAREEAERRERIQKKLEALGPLPDKKSDKKEAGAKAEAVLKPKHIQQREQPEGSRAPESASAQGPGLDVEANAGNADDIHDPSQKDLSPKGDHPPGPATRRFSHGQDGRRVDLWVGSGPRPDRFSSWAGGAPPPSRNVWGSPDNDRGLGNGTFNPDLGRIPGTTVAPSPGHKGPAPIAPPSTGRPPTQRQAPIGSSSSRHGPLNSDLAQKWVAAVAENDKSMSAARLAERVGRERQLAEQGLSIEDAQPTIKDSWRPVQLPGDGTRRTTGTIEVHSHGSGSWKATQPKGATAKTAIQDVAPSSNAGVIGSGGSSILSQAGSGTPSQSRASRFFPATKGSRQEAGSGVQSSRPTSPSPPPPTMEGHPAYEGDVLHPHVSLPRPQPVVKLPPSMMTSHAPQLPGQPVWTARAPGKDHPRGTLGQGHISHKESDSSQGSWQDRINNLLNGGKASPPKHIGVDPASRSMLDHVVHADSATVSLPNINTAVSGENEAQRRLISKPMAEECFEEQEMGSLPQIRLPHVAPEAAWQPAVVQAKPLPKKFLVQASIMEPYYFAADVVGGGNAVKIQFPGMTEARIATIPFSATRGHRGGHGRPAPRHRGSGGGSRGPKREPSSSYTAGESTSSGGTSRGGTRGSHRSRGGESWNRQAAPSTQSPAQPKTQATTST
ncbi:hypothetical protein JDV02_006498 [Purpureocillium takamizusanense]|uniref:Uncharacterized protein n=1 Tax=Purpureocillium takamizusanense TaxID=2060973 RepID=A0A9Q8QIE4_9HYPO|nr:uncharacterized protein JDV02_006498 [Purpureocillium takamizusanense]UNI20408.1 hypothetical protein JDV02_006498 [Purpureocillium takamizusanense]